MEVPIIETVIHASEVLENCKLELEKISQLESIKRLNQYFGTSTVETVLIVTVFRLSADNSYVDRDDMAKFLSCNPIHFFKHEHSFRRLQQNKLLETNRRLSMGGVTKRMKYVISDKLHHAIVENLKYEVTPPIVRTDPVELLTDLANMIEEREHESIDTYILSLVFIRFVSEHSKIPLFRNLRLLEMDVYEKMWLVLMINSNLNGKLSVDIEDLGEAIFSKPSDKINFATTLHDQTNALIANNWIAFSSGGFFNKASVALTQKTQDFLSPLGIKIRIEISQNDKHLITPEAIVTKKLFYNEAEAAQVASLANSLKYRNHAKIQKRLKAQGLRTGICTLLYGAPGTGKTESVYQIAKQTGRPLWKVDLTQLKSMWFGESQKLVKGLFDSYKKLCEDQKRTPILLLNEADAILGQRKGISGSSAQGAENAIQNIFLDCLEDFEGILFATTNMEQSLDPAFERRFLFKIKFEYPEALAQQNIWKAMCPELSKAQAKNLSATFNLSGGEIENVLRKLSMMRVLQEKLDIFDTVKNLRENEHFGLGGKVGRIGYYK